MFRPHTDVISAAQAGKPSDGPAFYLDTHRGTKGGRERLFPVDNAVREDAIDYARRVAVGVDDSVSDPRLTLLQAMRRLRYVMERFGVTRAGLGVVPHGLRHEGAAEDFEQMTGVAPPIAGGPPADPDIDHRARVEISNRLGHGRTQITNVYLGQSPVMRSKARKAPPAGEPDGACPT